MNLWIKLLPKWAAVNLAAYALAPYLATQYEVRNGLCNNGHDYLDEPRLLLKWWEFQTPDNSLLGDGAWKAMEPGHWPWRDKLACWPALQSYAGRLGWLWRNPAYGCENSSLAAFVSASDGVTFDGDPWIQDGPNGREGVCFVKVGQYWSYNRVKRIGGSRCIKIELGWKLKTYAEDASRLATEPVAQYALSIRFPKFVK